MMSLPRLRDSRDFSPYSSSAEWADEALLCRSVAFSPAFLIASRFFNTVQTVDWARPKTYLLPALSSSEYLILPPMSDYFSFAMPFQLQQCLQNVLGPLLMR
ncbi:hypothetical protein E2C01_094930 [Portunus trituberculatus]|uniref:Uncharacterized protein n=1 Tax=Portunus trituberculatus TaxID=210409 RepID=A0A5B7JNH0_PORTR|nr:hypothetical protein [Portunus trituberculatus]